jgi:hypothetical protein
MANQKIKNMERTSGSYGHLGHPCQIRPTGMEPRVGTPIFKRTLILRVRETLNKSAFYGERAQLCDAGINKINVPTPLILPQKFPHLFNQPFLRRRAFLSR